ADQAPRAVGLYRLASTLLCAGQPIDHAIAAQRGDFRVAASEFIAQDLHRVLAQGWRRGRWPLGRAGKFYRASGETQAAGRRMVGFDHHLARDGMRMGQSGADSEYRSVRHVETCESLL